MRRWEELRPELDARNVALVTLCTDTPGQIRKGMGKHGAQAVMLSDRDLSVTRQLGLENRNTSLRPPGLSGLPIPTTILCDADGVVRWIDQSEDYMVRSQPDRVLAALEAVLPRDAGEPFSQADVANATRDRSRESPTGAAS